MLDIRNPRIRQPILGNWDLVEKIGSGKHGTVYRAVDKRGHTAAIKIISLPNDEIIATGRDYFGDDREKMENFVGEIAQKFGNEVESMRVLSRNSDNIIRLYDNVAQQNGICWDIIIIMEYAIPLKKYFNDTPLRVGDVINLACDIASGLTECERNHIIHRDIKEDNLFLSVGGIGKMGDFGVASINETGLGSTMGMGTPYYMAPEVTFAKHYDNTVDIYSLGIVLYKMLNGNRFPFVTNDRDNTDLNKAYERRRNGERLPFPQYASPELGEIVLKCCEYDPADRFRNGDELYQALVQAESRMSDEELNREIPYILKSGSPYNSKKEYNRLSGSGKKSGDSSSRNYRTISDSSEKKINSEKESGEIETNGRKSKIDSTGTISRSRDWLMSTISIIQGIINKEGRNSTIARGFTVLTSGVDKERYKQQRERYKKQQRLRWIVIALIGVLFLSALLVFLYPKAATFYVDNADNDRIHVKYLFMPDRRKADIAASYLSVEGNWMYFSNPDEDHSLYKLSIWGGEPKLLCEDDCEYDILIDDYIYYTHYDDGEKLYRIKTDGTGKQCILEYACRDLRRNGKNVMFKLAETGELKELDTTTIQ